MEIPHTHIVNGFLDHYISPFDRGFAYGDGVFRTLKIVNGVPLHWPQHYQKLVADCAVIGIVCPSAEILIDDIGHLFSPTESAVAKITITRGEGERGYKLPSVTMPTRLITKSILPTYPEQYFTHGVKLLVCETRLAAQPNLAGIKHLNRLENVIARMEWQDETLFDGVLLNMSDQVIEGTMSNIFARFGDVLLTPDLSRCGVAGITRQQILGLATPLKLNVVVRDLPLALLLKADEVIVCNSLISVLQVTHLQHQASHYTWQSQHLAQSIRDLIK